MTATIQAIDLTFTTSSLGYYTATNLFPVDVQEVVVTGGFPLSDVVSVTAKLDPDSRTVQFRVWVKGANGTVQPANALFVDVSVIGVSH